MGESSKKLNWDVQFTNPDIRTLNQQIISNPTQENLVKLFNVLKDENPQKRAEARTLFLYYVAKCNINKPVKNEFLKAVTDSKKDFTLYSAIIYENVKEILDLVGESEKPIFSSHKIYVLIPVINSFYHMCLDKDNEKLRSVIECSLPLYDNILDNFILQLETDFEETYNFKNEDLLMLANQTMKQVLWIFAKKPNAKIEGYILGFLDHSYRILSFEQLPLDMKIKCALIFLSCLKHLPTEELDSFVFREKPILEVFNDPDDRDSWICGRHFKFPSLLDNTSARVALHSALFSSLAVESQLKLMLISGKCVFQVILEEMLSCSERPIRDNTEIVEISRILLSMSINFSSVPIPLLGSVFPKCFSYACTYSDYHVDAVQKNSSLFLGHLVKCACFHYKSGTDIFVNHLMNAVNLREGRRKADFLTIMYMCTYLQSSFLLQSIPFLRELMLQLLEDPVCFHHAYDVYELLMKEHYKETTLDHWLSIWVRPAVIQLRRAPMGKTEVYQKIICRAFQLNQSILRDLFPNKYMGSQREWGVLLKCLTYARNSKLKLSIGTYDSTIYWWGLIEKTKLKMFSIQRDDVVRLAALRVVVECDRTTEYYTEWEFSFLVDYYQLNACNQTPNIRKEIVALYKKGISRYFASFGAISKQIEVINRRQAQKKTPNTEQWLSNYTKLQKCYLNFMSQFIALLITNISPAANFYRRNAALELLMFIQPQMDKIVFATYWKSDDIENLKLVLQDNYEINKKMAIAILAKFDAAKFKFDDTNYYASYFSEALALASDIKPSKSLSAAYMFQLCCYSPVLFLSDENLENYGESNEMVLNIIIILTSELMSKINNGDFDDVDEASLNAPCYGILTCLRYLIRYRLKDTWNAIYASTYALVFTLCQRIFRIVLPIVSNPAPEGYLPENEETEISIRDDTARSQRILVFAWRTVKEITLLFAEFACQDSTHSEHKVLSSDEYALVGELFMEIFVQARHRGVFEQAYVGFCLLCENYWRSQNENIRCLPKRWMRRGLDLVTGKELDDRLSSTRRSAGMPFLLLAILTTDPSLDKSSFHITMRELSVVAANQDEKMMEFRIHALNISRFLFRHTKFGDNVAPYIEKSVELALKGMQSTDWGIRNSSTLLFSALVTRIFGVQRTQDFEQVSVKNKMTVKLFSTRYPNLFNFLLDTLKMECENRSSCILHPILLIFSRLYPSHMDTFDGKVEGAIPYLRKCLGNPSQETRKLAARASMASVFPKDLHLTVKSNFEIIAAKEVGNNECHGLLLEVWYILKYHGEQLDLKIEEIVVNSMYVLENAGTKFSHHCVALYMDVLTVLFGRYEERVDLDILKKILTSISRLMEEQKKNLTGRHNFEAAMINLTITILLVRLEHVETTFQAINFDFENYMLAKDNLVMRTYCLYFVLYVNITYNEMDIPDPPVYIFEEMKPPEAIKDVISNFNKPTKCEFLTYIHKFMVGYLRGQLEGVENPVTNECFILNLLILPYYPCLISSMNGGNKRKTLDQLINFCSCDKEELISAVITCISVLLCQMDSDCLKSVDYRRLIKLLRRSVAPEAAVYRRFSVCQFLLKCKFLYFQGMKYMRSNCVIHFLAMVLFLLEDDAIKIRNEISALIDDENMVLIDEQSKSGWHCIPDKARYDVMKLCCKILPKALCISFLFAWCIRHFPDGSNDPSNVFERSELNAYVENIPHVQIAGKMLSIILWSLPYDLTYENKTIFIEEQCQMVTTILLDAINQYTFSIVEPKTKISVICAFKSILSYLELNHVNSNFKYKFSQYFQKKILYYFQRHVCKRDFDSVKKAFLVLYHPVLLEIDFK